MGNNGKVPVGIPLIRPTADVNCWVCGRQMRVPPERLKAPRIICGQCAQEFDAFLWSLFKQARETQQALNKLKNPE